MADGGMAAPLVGLLVQYGLPALLVLVLLYVERLARGAVQEERVPPMLGTAVLAATWASIFALIGLVAWQMIEDRARRTWVVQGRIFGIESPLRLEVSDKDTYVREVPPIGATPQHVEWVVLTNYPLRDRCLYIRIVGADPLPLEQPDGQPLGAFALSVTSDKPVSLQYEPEIQRMTFTDRASEPLPHSCGAPGPMPPQHARQGGP